MMEPFISFTGASRIALLRVIPTMTFQNSATENHNVNYRECATESANCRLKKVSLGFSQIYTTGIYWHMLAPFGTIDIH